MNENELIWNRAAMDGGGTTPARGDRALSDLLYAHGLVMNGGVLHAAELLTSDELLHAQSGYAFFGLNAVSDLLSQARSFISLDVDLDQHEHDLDCEYMRLICDDEALYTRFIQRLQSHPSDFAPPV